eukprot:gb/GECG01001607.1/.p1 GENE.gb/GECG01001607.1/~~gb/GECG01001607.1/.p1  ORF type:complete len:112 (+),score=2.97 gb/GECG01001607.1/:1-336(+)
MVLCCTSPANNYKHNRIHRSVPLDILFSDVVLVETRIDRLLGDMAACIDRITSAWDHMWRLLKDACAKHRDSQGVPCGRSGYVRSRNYHGTPLYAVSICCGSPGTVDLGNA